MKRMKLIAKKLSFLIVMVLPLVVIADMPHPKYVYRLHRIGFEILPDYSNLWFVVAAFVVGFSVLLFLRKNRWKKSALVFLSVLCCLYVVFVLLGGFFSNCFESLRFSDERKHEHEWDYTGVLHSDQPGWKYEELLSQSEKEAIAQKTTLVIDELQKAIDASGITIAPAEHWQGRRGVENRKIRAITSVLEKNDKLRKKCKGIPVEWLKSRITFGGRAKEEATKHIIYIQECNRIFNEKFM